MIALPVANADPACDQTVGNSIDSYLKRHPDVHQQRLAHSRRQRVAAPTSSTTSIGTPMCGGI